MIKEIEIEEIEDGEFIEKYKKDSPELKERFEYYDFKYGSFLSERKNYEY